MNRKHIGAESIWGALGIGIAALGCSSADPPSVALVSEQQRLVGAFLPGLEVSSDDLLDEAVEQITDGAGPIFTARACGNCHLEGALGGSGPNTERRFGRFVNNVFDPMASLGGSLRQLFSVANFNNPNLPQASRGRCQMV